MVVHCCGPIITQGGVIGNYDEAGQLEIGTLGHNYYWTVEKLS